MHRSARWNHKSKIEGCSELSNDGKMTRILMILTVLCAMSWGSSRAIQTWLNHTERNCINCLCHARTGCWNRVTCASYSIDFDYWKKAGSVVIDPNDQPDQNSSYVKCMENENCVVGTIIKYTESFGTIDCNCDGSFDCKDRSAIHLFGGSCINPNYGTNFAKRFNECASSLNLDHMLSQEGSESCQPESF